MFDFTDERDWLKVFGTDLDLSHFISEPVKEVKTMKTKTLIDREVVFSTLERVANEAIEKRFDISHFYQELIFHIRLLPARVVFDDEEKN